MRYILAFDSFKGCLSSTEAADAACQGIRHADKSAEIQTLSVSDGGEGLVDAYRQAVGGQLVEMRAHDAMMRRLTAHYLITPSGKTVIEAAATCGLALLSENERNPMRATSFGIGEMIAHAVVEHGSRQFIIGLGGTATSDCGIGLLQALTSKITPNGHFDDAYQKVLRTCTFTLACDVDNPLLGTHGAAQVFARQKGADEAMIAALERRAEKFAELSAKHFHRDLSQAKGAGAAGGIGYAMMQYLNAEYHSGADHLLDLLQFETLLDNGHSIVVTGEGRSDAQTLMGKLPQKIMLRARRKNVPTWLVSGELSEPQQLLEAGFEKVVSIRPAHLPLEAAMQQAVARQNLSDTMQKLIQK